MLETRTVHSRFQHIVVKNKKGDDIMLDEVIHQEKIYYSFSLPQK
jgi:hypothetical protein